MAMVVALLSTTFEGANQKSRRAYRTPQFRLLWISLLTPAPPPPGVLVVASSLDPVVVNGEDRSANSPSVAGEEVALPTETVLSTSPPTGLSFKFMRLVLAFVIPNNFLLDSYSFMF